MKTSSKRHNGGEGFQRGQNRTRFALLLLLLIFLFGPLSIVGTAPILLQATELIFPFLLSMCASLWRAQRLRNQRDYFLKEWGTLGVRLFLAVFAHAAIGFGWLFVMDRAEQSTYRWLLIVLVQFGVVGILHTIDLTRLRGSYKSQEDARSDLPDTRYNQ